jgi:hypothetical protein
MYIVRHKNAADVEYANYRKAVRAAVSMCGLNYPCSVICEGKELHRFEISAFGGLIFDHIEKQKGAE